jgi:hypothetical protein
MLLKKLKSPDSGSFILWEVWQLLVLSKNNDALPLIVRSTLIDLEAHLRIGAHPLDPLPKCGESVDVISMKYEIDRYDIGLIVT